jgi:adenosylcobinamide-GDP ribazoletransferase
MRQINSKDFFAAQLELFFIALGFFSRIPVPHDLNFSQEKLNQASRYFTLVGWLIGVLCALVFYFLANVLPISIALLLSMGVGFLITGGFHEDGLADTADGLGGGWSVEQKLSIMKDSRLGSYGSLALWFALTCKYMLLLEIATDVSASVSQVGMIILIAHPLSRMIATAMIYILPYVTNPDQSKVKPLAQSPRFKDMLINLVIGLVAGLVALDALLMILLMLLLVAAAMFFLMKRQLGGFTGDTLGATQQFSELAVYMGFIINLTQF